MTAALRYLSQMTNEIFESQMQHVAGKIVRRQQLFARHA
jgi:hypothetical protein